MIETKVWRQLFGRASNTTECNWLDVFKSIKNNYFMKPLLCHINLLISDKDVM